MESLPFALGNDVTALARPLLGLALAADARTVPLMNDPGCVRGGYRLSDGCAPRRKRTNQFPAHAAAARGRAGLGRWRFGAAALAFDAAREEVAGRQRPWHRALITERAARFTLARGLQHGFELLAQARQEYLAWGATAKVAQLDSAYPRCGQCRCARRLCVGLTGDLPRRAPTSAPEPSICWRSVGLAGVELETSIEGLHARVVDCSPR